MRSLLCRARRHAHVFAHSHTEPRTPANRHLSSQRHLRLTSAPSPTLALPTAASCPPADLLLPPCCCCCLARLRQIEFAADQISAEWLDDLLVGARDSHRAFERSSSDLEDATSRVLALKKAGRPGEGRSGVQGVVAGTGAGRGYRAWALGEQ